MTPSMMPPVLSRWWLRFQEPTADGWRGRQHGDYNHASIFYIQYTPTYQENKLNIVVLIAWEERTKWRSRRYGTGITFILHYYLYVSKIWQEGRSSAHLPKFQQELKLPNAPSQAPSTCQLHSAQRLLFCLTNDSNVIASNKDGHHRKEAKRQSATRVFPDHVS